MSKEQLKLKETPNYVTKITELQLQPHSANGRNLTRRMMDWYSISYQLNRETLINMKKTKLQDKQKSVPSSLSS